ncbi:MAG: ABC transporter substrate-binding protein [Rhodospirillales bacterium]|nr:ABC transporter substrate-binding protein [Alphaproteobacteria bacterium]MCB9986757.1 ABC transporter substrate-binding protein [Rhodospirillales bacterium]USO08472.1 MAG: ABC transporter substrate-binding protein [Rhodospirillales bacterium]
MRLLTLVLPFLAAAATVSLPAASSVAAPLFVPAQGLHVQPVAQDPGAAAQALIQKLGDTATSALSDQSLNDTGRMSLFRKILAAHFDTPLVARFAAGRYWRAATPQQQSEYVKLYQQMILNVYSARFKNYSGQKFTVTGDRADGASGDIIVTSQVTGKGSPITVDWRVRNTGGADKIIDVMVEGVSMAITQRNDFASVIQQGGGQFTALIDYLRDGGTSDVKD